MRSVNIAKLKNQLSSYVRRASSGEQILIRDRNLPVARLVPYSPVDPTSEELALVASGDLILPEKTLDEAAFWNIGRAVQVTKKTVDQAAQAISEDRDGREAGLLGR